MVRILKKKYYLPLKWRLAAWAEAYSVEYPHPNVLQDKIAELRTELLKAKQEGREMDAASAQGMINGVKWVLKYAKIQGE